MKTDMRGIATMWFLCAVLLAGHAPLAETTNQPPNLETICESLNPYNDEEILAEWKKIEKALEENGISQPGSLGSIMEVFFVPADQAEKARQIISQMIKDKKVDAVKMRLKVRKK